MRNAFARVLTEIAPDYPEMLLLTGDIGNRLFDSFKEISPNNFFNCGIAEANMIGMAAGLAMSGFRPFVYTITPFITLRCIEQIRDDLCYHDLPVTFVGTGSGLSYAELGPTHHSLDDIGTLRTFPNLTILTPSDIYEVESAVKSIMQRPPNSGPVYLRLGKKNEPLMHSKPPHFEIGKPLLLQETSNKCDIIILSVGNIAKVSCETANVLEQQGLSVRVVSFHTIKPLPRDYLTQAFEEHSLVVTIEEHSKIGGLGSAVAEWLIDTDSNAKLLRFGTEDSFLKKIYHQHSARSYFGLTSENISSQILQKIRD